MSLQLVLKFQPWFVLKQSYFKFVYFCFFTGISAPGLSSKMADIEIDLSTIGKTN